MKYLCAIFLFAMIGCKKNIRKVGSIGYLVEATVIKDCTGFYLRYNALDYNVCNSATLDKYDNGAVITATFNKVEDCSTPPIPFARCFIIMKGG